MQDIKDKIAFAIEDFNNIQALIRFIDQKAGAILVIYGFLITLFIEYTKDLRFTNPLSLPMIHEIFFSILTFILGILLISTLIFQVYFVIFEIIQPKAANNYCSNENCIYYFKHIANMTKNDFKETFHNLDNQNILDEVLGQVYEVSLIMDRKSNYLRLSVKILFTSIILLLMFTVSVRFL